jgi:ubiquinone/menaquinone biosynthesis C-methylase UbiE
MDLDVGCGVNLLGDVNCDLYVKDVGHRGNFSVIPVKDKNFIVCDGQYLPFKDGVFSRVFCYHLIEHVKNPFLLIQELKRVCLGLVFVRCPHRLGDYKIKNHLHKFSRKWFADLGAKCKVTKLRGFPFKWFGLIRVPYEIEAVFEKWEQEYNEVQTHNFICEELVKGGIAKNG